MVARQIPYRDPYNLNSSADMASKRMRFLRSVTCYHDSSGSCHQPLSLFTRDMAQGYHRTRKHCFAMGRNDTICQDES